MFITNISVTQFQFPGDPLKYFLGTEMSSMCYKKHNFALQQYPNVP